MLLAALLVLTATDTGPEFRIHVLGDSEVNAYAGPPEIVANGPVRPGQTLMRQSITYAHMAVLLEDVRPGGAAGRVLARGTILYREQGPEMWCEARQRARICLAQGPDGWEWQEHLGGLSSWLPLDGGRVERSWKMGDMVYFSIAAPRLGDASPADAPVWTETVKLHSVSLDKGVSAGKTSISAKLCTDHCTVMVVGANGEGVRLACDLTAKMCIASPVGGGSGGEW